MHNSVTLLGANLNIKNYKLPIGLCNSPDIFQEKMNELLNSLKWKDNKLMNYQSLVTAI